MKSLQSKNIKPTNSSHSPFFQKESNTHFFENSSKPFFNASPVQAKLKINQTNDPYEKEADAIADKVVQHSTDKSFLGSENNNPAFFNKPNLTVQRKCAECEKEEKLQKKENEKEKPEDKIQKKPIFESNAEPNDDEIGVQRKCAECEKEEKVQKKPLLIQKQEETGSSLGESFQQPSANTASPATSESVPSSPAATGQTSTNANADQQGQFIVDDATTPSAGQMRRSDFLKRLNDEICVTVDQVLQGTPFSSDNCPYIRAAFARYKNSSPIQLEQAIQQYGLSIHSVQSAEDIIQQMKVRVAAGVQSWIKTGDLSGLPEDILAQIPASIRAMAGIAGTIGNISQSISTGVKDIASGISNAVVDTGGTIVSGIKNAASTVGDILFKANDGGAQVTQSPASVMQSLGKGNSIEGSTRSKMENAFGINFSDVEIHTDNNAANLSKNMNARAFTVGNHIAFASGEHQPGTLVGDALMAHELAHVHQQSGMNNSDSHSYDSLERDADDTAVGVMTKTMSGKDISSLKNKSKGLKTGLRLSRCSKSKSSPSPSPSPAPTSVPAPASTPTIASQTQLTSGGISGLVLNATFSVSNTPCQTLQIIQVFWGTRREDNLKVGAMTFTENGKTYDAFVDGGKNSPFVKLGGNPPADANNPYYLTQQEHANQVSFAGNNGTIMTYDQPGAVAAHKEAFFETAVVCVNHNSTGVDKILTVFKWGWTGKGTTPIRSGGVVLGGTPTGIQTSNTPSARFGQIIANDYPGYTFN